MNWGMPLPRYMTPTCKVLNERVWIPARLFLMQWSFDIFMDHLTIQSQRSNSVKTLREIRKSWNRFYGQLSYRHRSQSWGSWRSWLKIGCSQQRPSTLRQISPRKLQAVSSSHPTRYLGGRSCTRHVLLDTPRRVTEEPTHLAWQRKWKQSNETCSLPCHMAWPLHRWASKLYACAAALVARWQPVQVCCEASRNALRIHRLTDGLSTLRLMLQAGMQDARAQRNQRNPLRTWPQRKQWVGLQDLPRMRCHGRLGKTLLQYVAYSISPTAWQAMSDLFLWQDNLVMDHGDQLRLFTRWSLRSVLCISIHHIAVLKLKYPFWHAATSTHQNFPDVQMLATFTHKSEARERPQALPLESRAEMRARK